MNLLPFWSVLSRLKAQNQSRLPSMVSSPQVELLMSVVLMTPICCGTLLLT